MKTLQELFREARGDDGTTQPHLPRSKAVKRAFELEGCPEHLSEYHLLRLETSGCRIQGKVIRYLAAATGVSLLEILESMDLWPPVSEDPGELALGLLRTLGADIRRQEGRRVLLILPESER